MTSAEIFMRRLSKMDGVNIERSVLPEGVKEHARKYGVESAKSVIMIVGSSLRGTLDFGDFPRMTYKFEDGSSVHFDGETFAPTNPWTSPQKS